MLDLASEMLAGATMEDVSTVLYYKVLQWAGYSRNLKVAAFERMVEEGRPLRGIARARSPGTAWRRPGRDVQNDPLVDRQPDPEDRPRDVSGAVPDAKSFTTEHRRTSSSSKTSASRRCSTSSARRAASRTSSSSSTKSASTSASRDNLILNLDGLAKNLKRLGDGKVWIIGTAQQTLTEDDPRAALNSPELYKLKDRFPIQIDLESSDIKEICYRRLLGKSPAGETDARQAVRRPRPGAAPQHQAAGRQVLRRRLQQGDLRQPLPVPAGPLRHPAAPAGRAGQVHRRHRPALGDQGDPGHPDRGRRRRNADGRPARRLAGHHRHAVRRAGERHPPRLPVHPPGRRQGR